MSKTSRRRKPAAATVAPPAPTRPRSARAVPAWAASLLIVALSAVAYANSFAGPFIFDDRTNVRDNFKIRRLWPIWETMWGPLEAGVSGRPTVQVSFALNYAVSGLNVAGYHAGNLILHALVGLALFGVIRRTLNSAPLAPRFGEHATPLALLITSLWQVHPLLTDSVTYISGRTEILAALFLLLTLYCAIRAADVASRPPRLWQCGAVVACALGTGAKEIIVAAPLLVLLYDALLLGGSLKQALRTRAAMYVGLFATLALIPFNLYMADFHRSAIDVDDRIGVWDYLKVQSRVLTHYLRLSVWPHPLVVDYAGAWPRHPKLADVLPHAATIVALLALTGYGLLRGRPAAYAGAWFFLILAPTSSFLPLPTEIATERRMYLPLMAIVALAVLAGYRLLTRAGGGRAYLAGAGAAALVGALAVQQTLWRNGDYKNPINLWADVVVRQPDNRRALVNLAYEFLLAGDPANAKECYRKLVQLDPGGYDSWNNLAVLYLNEGNDVAAMDALTSALKVNPNYAYAHLNLGRAHHSQGRFDEAERSIRHAMSLEPGQLDHLVLLAKVQSARGAFADAERTSRDALRLSPDSASAHAQLGVALAGQGRDADALTEFRTSLRLAPGDPEYATHLAWLVATATDPTVRNPPEAVKLASRIVEARGGTDAAALDALAVAYAAAGQFDAAANAARHAVGLMKPTRPARAEPIERRLEAYAAGRMPDKPWLELRP